MGNSTVTQLGPAQSKGKDRKPRVAEPPSFAPCLTSLRDGAVPRHKAYPIWTW